MHNDSVPSYDRNSISLGTEDNRLKALANEKAYKSIFIFVSCSIVLFFSISSGQNRSDKAVFAIKRGELSESYNLRAEFNYEGETLISDVQLTVNPKDYKSQYSETGLNNESWLSDFAQSTISSLEKDNSGDTLKLPSNVDGVSINWILPKDDSPTWIFAICLLLCTFVYFSRFDEIKKEKKKYRQEIISEIPNMSRQLILLLNAGLVVDIAFLQLYEQTKERKEPLYIELKTLYEKSVSDNSPFAANLYSYALSFADRDLVRFATLIFEHKGRGSELAGKLEAEGQLLYENRLAFAKAKAKEAETRLCFPLILLLISLVIICIAPAMLNV